MDGIHDCGGMHGFGRVEVEENEPYFHAEWERRIFAVTMVMPAVTLNSDDQYRRDIERMGNAGYLNSSYYEKWLESTLAVAKEYGLTTDEELAGGPVAPIPDNLRGNPPITPDQAWDVIQGEASQELPNSGVPQGFQVGDRVRTLVAMGPGHTRLPRYARDKVGTIESAWGTFIYADDHAAKYRQTPVHLYSVMFASRDLWGDEAAPDDTVMIDLFEPYLLSVYK